VIRHIVVLTFRSDATAAERAAVSDSLAALPAVIPEIRSYSFGEDLGLTGQEGLGVVPNASYGIVADFETVADYARYRDHPAHQAAVRDRIRPILEARAVVQVDLP